ncbi:MAG: glycosyltransferase involved in cell wall biosynthesis [Ulvibacter sp.]|jgi:glycosyltransferase involved in cell wall biosynthesis
MRIYIVIPTYNEEAYLAQTLQSLVEQTIVPNKMVIVNDNSSDNSQKIIDDFSSKYSFITGITHTSAAIHEPGSKVINAFNKGLEELDDNYDVLCKFDADLIFPKHYLESIISIFKTTPGCGMAGGFCYIKEKDDWKLENLTNKDHIRGALKAYKKECFKQIGGLKSTMGWDTIDELLAQHQGWKVTTDSSLHVRHMKPTGSSYSKTATYKQGEAFYKMRYGFLLTLIAAIKLGFLKKNLMSILNTIKGYYIASGKKQTFSVSEEEGKFIRNLRWRGIKKKIL